MLGHIEKQKQQEFFTPIILERLIPEDHILKRVDRVLDLSFVRDEVRHLYDETNGRPSIDPEAALRLMLSGLFYKIIYDRELVREAQVNLAIRWFCGFGIEEKLPDHSSLTRIRHRWGIDLFQKLFLRIVRQCLDAGLIDLGTVHVDATLVRANASWDRIIEKHVGDVIRANDGEEESNPPKKGKVQGGKKKRKGVKKGKTRKVKVSRTDPESSVTKSTKFDKPQPRYKAHCAVDNKSGVVVDVQVTTGKAAESDELIGQIERIEGNLGIKPDGVTADSSYCTGENYENLEKKSVTAIIPTRKVRSQGSRFPVMRFKYDQKHDIVKCPEGKILTRRGRKEDRGFFYQADPKDCKRCRNRSECFPMAQRARRVLIVDGYASLLRARRQDLASPMSRSDEYRRHKWLVEGRHGEAKVQHGMQRAARRGLVQVTIQVLLTYVVMNLKRLAAAPSHALKPLLSELELAFAFLKAIFSPQPSVLSLFLSCA
jgi:transposase